MPNVIFSNSYFQSGDGAFVIPTPCVGSWELGWDVDASPTAKPLLADVFVSEAQDKSISSLAPFSTPARFYDASEIIRPRRFDEVGVRASLEFLAQFNFKLHPWEKKRHHWIVLAQHLGKALPYLDENRTCLDWPFYTDDINNELVRKAQTVFEIFDSEFTKTLAIWLEDFSHRFYEKDGRTELSLEGFGKYLRFREFVSYLDRQGFAPAYFRARQNERTKSFTDIVGRKINPTKEKLIKSFEAARLNEVFGLDVRASVGGIPIHESWRELWSVMGSKTWEIGATAYFSPQERHAFLRKIVLWEYHQDGDLANQALYLYKSLKTGVARAKYLKLLLYVRAADDLKFIVTTLCQRFDVLAEPEVAVAYLQSEYSWFYESGHHDLGFRFELDVLEAIASKGQGIRVVCAGSRVTTNRPGQSQEIDLHLLVANPDAPSETGEIFVEIFSGTDNGDKGDQLDNYARAASRHHKTVLFINNSNRDEAEIHSPRYSITTSGKHVWRLTYAQICKMDLLTLQRTLWRAYSDYKRRYF